MIGDALSQMVAYLDAHPAVGIVGPHTLNTDGTTQSTRRNFPILVTALFESTWLQRFAPPGVLRRYYVSDAPDEAVLDVGWVQGSALMTRREVYAQIGGLDEGYVMFSEEMDWCRRAQDAGWRVIYLGTAQIIHHGGKSTDQVVARRHIYFQQSKVRYFRKFHGPLVAEVLRLSLLAQYAWQWGLEWAKGRLGSTARSAPGAHGGLPRGVALRAAIAGVASPPPNTRGEGFHTLLGDGLAVTGSLLLRTGS